MKRSEIGSGALAGTIVTAPLIGILYLANKLVGLPFVPYDLFDWAVRILPGPVVTFGLDLVIDSMRLVGMSVANSAKTAEQGIAILQFYVIGVVVSTLFSSLVGRWRTRPDRSTGLVFGVLVGLPMIAVTIGIGGSDVDPVPTGLWLLAMFSIWGGAIQAFSLRLQAHKTPSETPTGQIRTTEGVSRRQFIVRVGVAAATITVVSGGLGSLLAGAARRELEAELADTQVHRSEGNGGSLFPNANDPIMPAPGTRPEYTPLKDHYKVFLRTQTTVIDGATWTLPILGRAANPMSLTLDDIRNNYQPREQYITLSCISGRVGTDLISTTQWTGASLQEILATVRPESDARYLHIRSGDGFYETVDLDLIASDERIMLSYAWDGNPIPIDHGFPLRIWIPDRYGMKQPKWITDMMLSEEYKEGYWVERGWDEVAQVKATSVIDTIAGHAAYESGGQMLVPVGGIAFAGARGISKVEVRVDGGPWREARLRAPLSETTWVIWRYDWPFEEGRHTFEVRCAEGDGTPQIEEEQDNRPSGASGIHRETARL